MRNGHIGFPISPDYRGADVRDAPMATHETRRCRAIKDGQRCRTILSRYNNDSDLCFACSAQMARGAKLELAPDDRPKKAKGKKGRAKPADEQQSAAATVSDEPSKDTDHPNDPAQTADPECQTGA